MEERHRKSGPMHMSHTRDAELLSQLQARFARRSRDGNSRVLDELCEDHRYEGNYTIKLPRDTRSAPSGRALPGPQPRYVLIEPIARTIWLAAAQPCGKRLAPALPQWLSH